MKTSLINIVTMISLSATLFLAVSSCSKENLPGCERWEVTDEHFTGGCIDLSCSGSRTLQLDFCGEGLKDAKIDNTVILSEDQCCKRTRTFKRFIKKV